MKRAQRRLGYRAAHGPRPGSENEFEEWLEAATERVDPFMAWLGLMFALLVGYETAVELTPSAARALMVAGWVVWAIFVLSLLRSYGSPQGVLDS